MKKVLILGGALHQVYIIKKAKEKNIKISCDLNYRKKLWTTEKANSVMSELFEFVDVCIANEEDVQNVFGLQGSYEELAQKIIQKFSAFERKRLCAFINIIFGFGDFILYKISSRVAFVK